MTKINPSINVEAKKINNEKTKVDKKETKKTKEKDVFMDSPLRCVGFLDEVGESLRPILSTSSNPLVSKLPNLAYIPATAYIVADVAHKYKKTKEEEGFKKAFLFAGREAAYQGVVSVAAPMLIAKGVNKGVQKFAKNCSGKAPSIIKKPISAILNKLSNFKLTSKIMNKANMPAKILGAGVTILALTKLAKPVDKLTSFVFKRTVDPLFGLNKKETKNDKKPEKND